MNRLKELRKEKKLTQKELANVLKINEKTISRWENNESTIKSNKAETLANFFGVSMGYLLGFTDDVNRYDDEEIYQVHVKGENEAFFVSSSKRDYAEQQKETKKQFSNFIIKSGFLISDYEIDTVFNLLSEMDLANPNTKKHALFFNKFAYTPFKELEQQGYSKVIEFYKKILSDLRH
ncbi:helix-turn-helix transcriptional regulator [Streptococcus sp. NLN64]|uniref:helix-turn-helix domain-containing protein n=1 Tax=Streptococcus sp. NLN64 TaxID=2822799 RepID=UPI0018CB4FFB|nr:helix-turn-helix transcriptional regulator [Streptococcus sp. NLN64]MBG9368280.1 helix-turn-helix transcriptional regulator [Streptococcus sp. NLN64]